MWRRDDRAERAEANDDAGGDEPRVPERTRHEVETTDQAGEEKDSSPDDDLALLVGGQVVGIEQQEHEGDDDAPKAAVERDGEVPAVRWLDFDDLLCGHEPSRAVLWGAIKAHEIRETTRNGDASYINILLKVCQGWNLLKSISVLHNFVVSS